LQKTVQVTTTECPPFELNAGPNVIGKNYLPDGKEGLNGLLRFANTGQEVPVSDLRPAQGGAKPLKIDHVCD
jgi:hypothetical protein